MGASGCILLGSSFWSFLAPRIWASILPTTYMTYGFQTLARDQVSLLRQRWWGQWGAARIKRFVELLESDAWAAGRE